MAEADNLIQAMRKIQLLEGDITRQQVDPIVNASTSGGGSTSEPSLVSRLPPRLRHRPSISVPSQPALG